MRSQQSKTKFPKLKWFPAKTIGYFFDNEDGAERRLKDCVFFGKWDPVRNHPCSVTLFLNRDSRTNIWSYHKERMRSFIIGTKQFRSYLKHQCVFFCLFITLIKKSDVFWHFRRRLQWERAEEERGKARLSGRRWRAPAPLDGHWKGGLRRP